MKGIVIAKRIVMVFVVATFVAAVGLNGHMTAEAAKTQMMEISCPHCHKYTTIDVMQDDVECTECLKNIHIVG